MSEIVAGDILTWDARLSWDGDDAGLLRALSWAVTIHATVPVLPPLRGGELIVVPMRTLRQLHQVEMVGWQEIARLLSGEAVSGVLVEHGFDGAPIAGVPFLRAAPELVNDAEPQLNRLITEHRASLYRLGSDLSRALSAASIGGADLDALLSVASDIGRRRLLLVDEQGAIVGRSRNAPDSVPFNVRGRTLKGGFPDPAQVSGDEWLRHSTRPAGGAPMVLAASPDPDGTPEAARLLLSQTATAIETFLGSNAFQARSVAPPSRETILAELMLGTVPEVDIAPRAQLLAIEPGERHSVGVFVGRQPGFDGRIRTGLRREIRDRLCMLSPLELAVLVPETGWVDWWPDLEQVAGSLDSVMLVRSEPQQGLARIARATRQARALGRLRAAGVSDGSTAFDLLLPLWDPQAFDAGPERLALFADRLLGPLEEHDRERGSDLVVTLDGFLAAGGAATGAARRLNVHRNTLGYRLRRITELTGADLDDEDVRLAYGLALKIRRLQELFV